MKKNGSKGLYTMIGEGAVMEGSLAVPHGLRIDGSVNGRIETSDVLTVGSMGVIEAEIKAKSAVVGGKITGNMHIEDRLELQAHASLAGNLTTRNLIVHEGAQFHGNCSMGYRDKESTLTINNM
jgi:cytoskeletal protein CcmA (bactofilin family)